MKYIFLSVSLIISLNIIGQDSIDYISELNYLADIQVMADKPEHREQAMEKYNVLMQEYMASNQYSRKNAQKLEYISQVSPSDNSFALLSWRVKGVDRVYYYGYVLTDSQQIVLHEDVDISISSNSSYNNTSWWGSIYYNLMTINDKDKTHHMVFGYNENSNGKQTKTVETIEVKDGKVTFGKPLFENPKSNSMNNRIVLSYAPHSSVTLNYNKGMELIMHDHLVRGMSPDGRPTMYPDGSYVGYEWNGQYWKYIEKIYEQSSEKAPRPKPLFGKSSGTGIFGKRRG